MNIFQKKFAEAFQKHTVVRRADKLLANKPEGFHPIQKKIYRRECKDVLDFFEYLIDRKQRGRIIGNKRVSNGTKLRVEKLKRIAR